MILGSWDQALNQGSLLSGDLLLPLLCPSPGSCSPALFLSLSLSQMNKENL